MSTPAPWLIINEPLTSTLSGAVFGSYSVGRDPAGICVDGSGNIWVVNFLDATVSKLNGIDGSLMGTFTVGGSPEGLCYHAATNTIWVANYADSTVTKLNLDGTAVGTYATGAGPSSCAALGANVFVANYDAGTVTKLLATTGAAVGSAITVGANPQSICADAAGVNIWTANLSGNSVTKITAATGAVVGTYGVGTAPSSVFAAGLHIWSVNSGSGNVTKLLASTGAVIGTYGAGSSTPQAGCFDGTNVWVTNLLTPAGTITALLESTGAALGTFPCGNDPARVCYDNNNGVWISDLLGAMVTRLSVYVGGLTDQTGRLDFASGKLTFNSMMRRRGTASVPLFVDANDTSGPGGTQYKPTIGSPVYLYDATPSGSSRPYAGTIDDRTISPIDNAGNLRIKFTAISLESVFDTILVNARIYEDVSCEFIFRDLLTLAAGSPVTAGVIQSGIILAKFVVSGQPKIADLFDQLASASLYVWGVDPADSTVYFHAPSAVPAPFELQTSDLQFSSFNLKDERKDYRNRQVITTSYDAFAHSAELFKNSDMVSLPQGPSSFRLARPVNQVTNAWFTYNTQNTASGTFTGQPGVNDALSVTFPQSGSAYNWAPSVCPGSPSSHVVGDIIIDPNGNIQKCTFAGTSKQLADAPAGQPHWGTNPGDIITDGPPLGGCAGVTSAVTWTCQGNQGFANNYQAFYVFVAALDNTQWGQVLIGATLAATLQNLVDAFNALDQTNTIQGGSATRGRGVTFSWPTWENPLVNAELTSGTVITVRNKNAGNNFIAALGTGTFVAGVFTVSSLAEFSWSAPTTSGGQTKFNTSICPVGVYGTLTTSGLAYQPASDVVSLSYPLGVAPNVGLMLQVEYTRADGDSITVENTAQVAIRAGIEHGTGKYQQRMTADPGWTNVQALVQVQAVLAAYCIISQTFMFTTLRPCLMTAALLTLTLATPVGFAALVNGAWVVQEVSAEWLPRKPYIDNALAPPGSQYGHFKYTVRVIDAAQIGDFIGFWRGLAGKGGGGSAVVVGGSQPSGILAPLNPGQIFAVEQSQIAGLGLTTADNPTIVYVKDYSHQLIWTGTSFQFADGGSNYYVFSDHAPSPGSPAVENGWAPCDGSTVNYLLGGGGLGTKTLPNLTGGSYFLELGTGTGATHATVDGIVTGNVAVTGTVDITAVTVTGNVSDVSLSGDITVTGLTVTGDVSGIAVAGHVSLSGVTVTGSVTALSGTVSLDEVSGDVDFTGVTNWINDDNVTLTGDSTAYPTEDDNLTITAVADFGDSDTTCGFGSGSGSSTTGITDSGHFHDIPDVNNVFTGEGDAFLPDIETDDSNANISDPGHTHSISASQTSGSGDFSGSIGIVVSEISGSLFVDLSDVTLSASGGADGTGAFSFVSGAGHIVSSGSGATFTQTGISSTSGAFTQTGGSTATWTQSGSGSGTGTFSGSSGTGTFSQTSGSGTATWSQTDGSISIGAKSVGGLPPRVSMQAWFRL